MSNSCTVKKGSSSSPKQPTTHVLAECSDKECSAERQRELIDCLTTEAIASKNLDDQLALDVKSLVGQLAAATDEREKSTAILFEVANRMNVANCEYCESVWAADTASRQLAEQRDVVRCAQALVNNLTAQLAEAKESMTAYVHLKDDTDEFSVYATGYQSNNNEHRPAVGTGSGVVGGVNHATVVDATAKPPPKDFMAQQPPPP
ncbi:unnamed protein product [Macrosiphum euphorbiae]|uniref:Uncharacterized protein n=1 Tax=Macrosiphum euphorbiae TaxID=13131 RepID=A0AAV0WMR7_9HEMI|nr:unnamed protein product [Macrosiphum euphorbiae]